MERTEGRRSSLAPSWAFVCAGFLLAGCGTDGGSGGSFDPEMSGDVAGASGSLAPPGGPSPGSSGTVTAESDVPIGIEPCDGVRPGATVLTPKGQCSLAFVFEDGASRRYISTAGHCILGESLTGGEDAGEETWSGDGPVALDGDEAPIGRFVYAVLSPPKDFALIRLDRPADPTVCHFGGPTTVRDDTTFSPVVLHSVGNGIAVGDITPARTSIAPSMPDPDEVFALGLIVPGDSGGPFIDQNRRAVGIGVTSGVHVGGIGTAGVDFGTIGITRIGPQIERAREALGLSELSLVPAGES